MISLCPDVALRQAEDGFALCRGDLVVRIARPSHSLRRVLQALSLGATEEALADLVKGEGGDGLAGLYYHLARLDGRHLLRYAVWHNGAPLISALHCPRPTPAVASERFVLSRFAYCRREGDVLLVESPRSPAQVTLHGPAAAGLLAALAVPISCHALAGAIAMPDEICALALGLLVAAQCAVNPTQAAAESDPAALGAWQFHDLLFHARTRSGRHAYRSGGTLRFLGKTPPLPAVKSRMSDEAIDLFRPDLACLRQGDMTLTAAVEDRASIREHGDTPITAAQLGEFLFRVARLLGTIPPDEANGFYYEAASRPYPSGGAIHELELYPVIARCEGLAAGVYHYDAQRHQLERLGGLAGAGEQLLRDGQMSTGHPPQVLISIAARFSRVMWKYDSLAYSLILKNVGGLYQTMYLVATAMGLAPCAVGGGPSAALAEAIGEDYYSESGVGEFVLGSRKCGK